MERLPALLDRAEKSATTSPGKEGVFASLIVDRQGLIRAASPAAERLLHAPPGGLVGRHCGFSCSPGEESEIDIPLTHGERLKAIIHCTLTEWEGEAACQITIKAQPGRRNVFHGNELLRALVAYSPLAIIATDLSGCVTLWNLAAVQLFGRSDVEMRGEKLPTQAASHGESLYDLFERVMGGESLHGVEVNGLLHEDGTPLELEVWATRMNNERGLPSGVLMMFGDISSRKRIEAHIRRVVGHDLLPGLPNRRQFQKQLQRLLKHKKQGEMLPTLVLQLGLDRFRTINKSLGPSNGDQLLREVSRRLAEALYETDLLARTGGDEFSILLRGTHQIEDGARVADRLRQRLAEPFLIAGQEVFVTASVGVAVAPDDGLEAEDLIRAADSAMARAKEQGGDSVQFFTRELDAQAKNRLVLENALRHAIDRQELFLAYQPKVDLVRRQVVGVEALLRWRHPEMGLIPPASFIPLAEHCGLIEPIGLWVIEEACRQLHAWDRAGLPPLSMSVNVSVRQFRNNDLRDQVHLALARHHLAPERLELEVTESMLMRNTPEAIRMLERLKSLRVRLAIDDFGTGFSCLSYLADLPVDTLKIDQSFVRGADGQIRNPPIVRAICTLASGLGLRTVAEGVESRQQLDYLASQGCDEVQGYLFAPPLSPEALAEGVLSGRLGALPAA
ncbi:MAG: EAL domain-containing protein [Rhodocyclaceae bacterium]|nr:EAL domain-containing protein [Rhodocyclaceae bacterium]